jgi:hypothetical protein
MKQELLDNTVLADSDSNRHSAIAMDAETFRRLGHRSGGLPQDDRR